MPGNNRRDQYPIEVDLPPARPVVAVPAARPAPAQPTMRQTAATYARAMFPQTYRAIDKSDADAARAWQQGDAMRTLGASSRKYVTGVPALAYDITVPAARAIWDGGGRLLGGLLGSDGSTTVNRAFTPPAPAAQQRAAAPVDAALQAGRVAATSPLTPQERMLAHLDTLLSRPMTQRGMQAVSGALAETTANSPRPRGAKDTVLDQTAEISQSVYSNEIERIMEARRTGAMTLEQAQAATGKATDAYFLRNTALVGNPLSFAQANMLPSPDEIEE